MRHNEVRMSKGNINNQSIKKFRQNKIGRDKEYGRERERRGREDEKRETRCIACLNHCFEMSRERIR